MSRFHRFSPVLSAVVFTVFFAFPNEPAWAQDGTEIEAEDVRDLPGGGAEYRAPEELFAQRRIVVRQNRIMGLLLHDYYLGTPDNRLTPRQFYLTIGEEELAERAFHVPRWIAIPLAVAFPLAGAYGAAVLTSHALRLDDQPGTVAGGIFVVSAATLGFFIGAGGSYLVLRAYHPVDRQRRQQLAREYNDNLRRDLGLRR